MKKIVAVCLLSPVIALAQKEIKPSVTKAESALLKGNFEEAKAIIDVTVTNNEFMVDKKGNPSKSAAKAWYLKGLIYAGIDTTKVEKVKALEANPFPIAKDAFAKAEEIDKGKSESLVNKLLFGQPIPMSKKEVDGALAQKYLERGYNVYKNEKDYKKAFADIEKVVFFVPNDTSQLMNAGVYFAPIAGEDDKAIEYINKYIAAGGKNTDAYVQLYSIYTKKKDTDSALKAAKQLTSMYPNNIDFLNFEYNIYVTTNKLPEAKALMMKRAEGDPADTESRFFLSLICKKMEQPAEARKWIEATLKINADHFDANEEMAAILSQEAKALNDQRNAIGTSKDADIKKRQDLRNQRFAKLKEIIPFAEKCVEVKPKDESSLYALQSLYDNLSAYDEAYEKKSTELKKKMKALGMEVD
ncbi:hypothetical protein WSM22_01300 [Cytophagales bacterium WSM2-2]|nr:hypothetical protein WSM22_01300 [Cytophagales bacterium WSM2-2]